MEELCEELFKKAIDLVHKTLAETKLKPTDIDELVVVGGSSRIPAIKKRLEDLFQKKLD